MSSWPMAPNSSPKAEKNSPMEAKPPKPRIRMDSTPTMQLKMSQMLAENSLERMMVSTLTGRVLVK